MRRRQALLLSLGGVLSLWSAGRLRADAVLPTTQVTTAAKPKSVQLFTASGAGDKDGRDWPNAMPIGALSKALSRARPGAGYLIGFDPAGGPIPLDEGQILIKVSGEEERPVFVQVGRIAGKHELAAAEGAAPVFKSSRPWSVENFGKRGSSFIAIANGASHLRLSG